MHGTPHSRAIIRSCFYHLVPFGIATPKLCAATKYDTSAFVPDALFAQVEDVDANAVHLLEAEDGAIFVGVQVANHNCAVECVDKFVGLFAHVSYHHFDGRTADDVGRVDFARTVGFETLRDCDCLASCNALVRKNVEDRHWVNFNVESDTMCTSQFVGQRNAIESWRAILEAPLEPSARSIGT